MLFSSSEILKSGLAELPVTFQVIIQLSPFHHPNVSQSCVCLHRSGFSLCAFG